MAEETQELAETTAPAATGAETAPETSSDVQSEGALNETATTETASETATSETVEAAPATDAATAENAVAETSSETSGDAPAADAPTEAPAESAPSRSSSSQPELSDVLSSHGEDNGPRKDVEGGRAYEIIYIARIGDESVNEATVTRVRELIDGKDGAVDNVRSTEARRLAYEIAGQSDGIYYVVNARFAAEHMSEIDRFFKLEESVIRHMILRED